MENGCAGPVDLAIGEDGAHSMHLEFQTRRFSIHSNGSREDNMGRGI